METAKDKAFWQRVRFAILAFTAFVFIMIVHGVYSWATGTLNWVGFWR